MYYYGRIKVENYRGIVWVGRVNFGFILVFIQYGINLDVFKVFSIVQVIVELRVLDRCWIFLEGKEKFFLLLLLMV